jgi:tetratricopeptide (TPR) repeat protein
MTHSAASGRPSQFDAGRLSLVASRAGGTAALERSDVAPHGPWVGAVARRWQVGDVLNERYAVKEVVGEGGMGLVYRVLDALHPERSVALKTLSPSFVDVSRVDLLKAEFRTMSELAHPNIAKVHDFESIAGTEEHAFTMELLDGRDLLTASAGQPIEQRLDWVVEACRALRYLHGRGVVHADFKPHNVVVTAAGHVKVLDFGLSGVSGAGLVLGTPAYMAPELRAGSANGVASDLYALGITLYQLVFGCLPFTGDSIQDVFRKHARDALPFPDGGAPGEALRGVIARLCAKRPEDRPASADEVIEALAVATGRAYAPETRETRRSYVSSARLVGREEEEHALLSYCLSHTAPSGLAADEVVLACVSGASGIGKSRLVREVRRRLQLVGTVFVEASCYDGGFGELAPIREWIEALRRLGRARGHEELERPHRAALDTLAGGALPAGAAAEEETARMMTLRGLADYVLDLSEAVGVVLSLNDLHWSGTATTDFLRTLGEKQLARRDEGRATRLSVVVAYRDDEVSGPLEDLLAAVGSERCLRVALSPLSAARTAELVASMLGTGDVPPAFSERVAAETGGNPFFIEEVMRVLMDRGDVYSNAGEWAARTEVARIELPSSIAAVLARRLASIETHERDALEWLAVYAQPMPSAFLPELGAVGGDLASAAVERLKERQMVVVPGAGLVRTAHDKLREHLYGEMSPSTRAARHASVARLLDRAATRETEYVIERAHHYWHAGDEPRSREWSARAAAFAERTFAMDVAIDNLDRLRTLADRHGDDGARRAAVDRMLELCAIPGQYARLLATADLELARRSDPSDRARLYQLQAEALGCSGRLAEAIEKLREATALLGTRVPRSRRARRLFVAAHYVRHLAATNLRRHDRARGDRLAPSERRRRELLGMCCLLMAIYSFLNGDEEGYGLVFPGLNAALALGHAEVLVKLLANAAFVHHGLGRFRESERLIRMAQSLARTDAERAIVLTLGVLARQFCQRPIFAGQRPIHAYEAEVVAAIELLSTRSRAIHANVARMVATTIVCKYALRYERRPEVARWAEAMRGTMHYGYVEGNAAVMALIDGDRRRAEKAYALAQDGRTPVLYRAWGAADFGYVSALTNDTAKALQCVETVRRLLPSMELKATQTLWVPAMTIAACVVLEARGVRAPWLRACLEEMVARLDRLRRRPGDMRLFHEAGRAVLGRSSLRALREAARASRAGWAVERAMIGHLDGCLLASLALRPSTQAADVRAASAWAEEALGSMETRFPPRYVARVRELLGEQPARS